MKSSYYKMNNKECNMIKKVSDITLTDYETIGEFIPVESLISALFDMLYEYNREEERIEDLKNEINENYELKKFNPYDEYGIGANDF